MEPQPTHSLELTAKQEFWLEHARGCETNWTGTVKAYADENGLDAQKLYSWRSWFRKKGLLDIPTAPADPYSFETVVVIDDPTDAHSTKGQSPDQLDEPHPVAGSVENRGCSLTPLTACRSPDPPPNPTGRILIHLPNQVRMELQGLDQQILGVLLRQAAGLP